MHMLRTMRINIVSNEQLKNDLVQICKAEWIDFSKFSGKTVFVTGATGLIGYTLVSTLLALETTCLPLRG